MTDFKPGDGVVVKESGCLPKSEFARIKLCSKRISTVLLDRDVFGTPTHHRVNVSPAPPIKVGDWVKFIGAVAPSEPLKVTHISKHGTGNIYVAGWKEDVLGKNEYEPVYEYDPYPQAADLRNVPQNTSGALLTGSTATPPFIRTVTRLEIVPGVYGIITIREDMAISMKHPFNESGCFDLFSPDQLREAAHILNQLAEYIDSKEQDNA